MLEEGDGDGDEEVVEETVGGLVVVLVVSLLFIAVAVEALADRTWMELMVT